MQNSRAIENYGITMLALTVPYLVVPLSLFFAEAFGVMPKMIPAPPRIYAGDKDALDSECCLV